MNTVMREAGKAGTKANVWVYRRTNGRVGGRGLGRLPLLLLTVRGRRSGTPRTTPVAYLDHNGGYLIIGTGMGGTEAVPQWFLNLQAAGRGQIQVRHIEHDVVAHLTSDAERQELWSQIEGRAPHFAKWQARTSRKFPVVRLIPGPSSS